MAFEVDFSSSLLALVIRAGAGLFFQDLELKKEASFNYLTICRLKCLIKKVVIKRMKLSIVSTKIIKNFSERSHAVFPRNPECLRYSQEEGPAAFEKIY